MRVTFTINSPIRPAQTRWVWPDIFYNVHVVYLDQYPVGTFTKYPPQTHQITPRVCCDRICEHFYKIPPGCVQNAPPINLPGSVGVHNEYNYKVPYIPPGPTRRLRGDHVVKVTLVCARKNAPGALRTDATCSLSKYPKMRPLRSAGVL